MCILSLEKDSHIYYFKIFTHSIYDLFFEEELFFDLLLRKVVEK